jgi:fucose 4-O-acetylase-like acetyltransferase
MKPIALPANVQPAVEETIAAHAHPGGTRLTMIDIAKGIGILLIVFGHEANLGYLFPELREILRSIRMPFFFFLSGVTFSVGRRSVSEVAVLRADAWLKPYVVTALLFGLINIFIYQTHDYENVALGIAYGTGFTLSPTAIWFLPHLWLLYVTSTALLLHGQSLIDSPRKRLLVLLFLMVCGYCLLGYFDSNENNPQRWVAKGFEDNLVTFGLPFSADLLPISMACFLFGNFFSKEVKTFQFNIVWMGLAALSFAVMRISFHYSMDLNYRRYDHLFVTTAQAVAGIYLFLGLSRLLSKSNYVSQKLIYIGRGSLFILLFHMPILTSAPILFSPWIHSKTAVSLCCLVLAVIVPLALWRLATRFYVTRLLFLPALKLKQEK